jgi:hypothetical protein
VLKEANAFAQNDVIDTCIGGTIASSGIDAASDKTNRCVHNFGSRTAQFSFVSLTVPGEKETSSQLLKKLNLPTTETKG